MTDDPELEGLAVMDPDSALEFLGDNTVFEMMLDGMSSCLIKQLTEIKVSLEACDYSSLKTELQSLKGATSYTRCHRVGKAAELFKAAIDTGRFEKVQEHYLRLIRESILLKRDLRKYICMRDSKNNCVNALLEQKFELLESDFDVPLCKHYEIIKNGVKDVSIESKLNSSNLKTQLEKIDEIDNEEEKLHIENEQKKSGCYCIIV